MPTQNNPKLIGGVRLRRSLIAVWCLVAVGCAQRTNEPPEEAIATSRPPTAVTAPVAAGDTATPEPPSFTPPAELTDSGEPLIGESPVTEPEPEPAAVSSGDIAPLEAAELAAVAPAAPAPQELEPVPGFITPSGASPASAETLDFSSLVTRLRQTKAINLRTKVAVKNESDELLQQFRVYHTQHGIVRLSDLRRSYDSLFHKLHSLLEDADPPLARDIDRSRAAIWELLADPRQFSASLMAGA